MTYNNYTIKLPDGYFAKVKIMPDQMELFLDEIKDLCWRSFAKAKVGKRLIKVYFDIEIADNWHHALGSYLFRRTCQLKSEYIDGWICPAKPLNVKYKTTSPIMLCTS